MIRKIGKQGRINQAANRKIAKMFVENDLYYCEIKLPDICQKFPVTPAHRHRRDWYKARDRDSSLLYSYSQVIAACLPCHMEIEKSRELTEEIFLNLRGPE